VSDNDQGQLGRYDHQPASQLGQASHRGRGRSAEPILASPFPHGQNQLEGAVPGLSDQPALSPANRLAGSPAGLLRPTADAGDEARRSAGNPVTHDSVVRSAVLIDADRVFVELLADRLRQERLCSSVQITDSSARALDLAQRQSNQLVISTWLTSDGTALTLADCLKQMGSSSRLLVLDRDVPESGLDHLLQLNVAGVVSKRSPLSTVLDALHRAFRGERAFCPLFQQQLLTNGRAHSPAQEVLSQLSPKHFDVLLQLAMGHSVKDVSIRLGLSVKSIDSIKYRLMKLLSFHDRVELTRFAIREGLIQA
jgi:DNA-binding NarL/FixJ family response regulator